MERAVDRQLLYTSSSRENFIFVLKLFVFIFILFMYFNHLEPEYLGTYNASLIDKMNRLESISEPKIVLIGNSNLVFGIESQMIEEELGMPVVNMGLHGGLGNAFHERMALINVHEGDIYIICHSDYSEKDTIINPELAWLTLENHYSLWRLLSRNNIKEMVEALPAHLKRITIKYASGSGNVDDGTVYSRSAINEYGDCGIYREGSIYTKLDNVYAPSISKENIDRLNELGDELTERGATLLIAGYPIGSGELTEPLSKFLDFQKDLEDNLKYPYISNITDYMFDYSYFYDSNYLHMNSEGARIRTEQLIEDIKGWMNDEK